MNKNNRLIISILLITYLVSLFIACSMSSPLTPQKDKNPFDDQEVIIVYSVDKDFPEKNKVKGIPKKKVEKRGYKLTKEDLPDLSLEGYTFLGWFFDGSIGRKAEVGNVITYMDSNYKQYHYLVAKFSKIKHTISFETDYGTKPEDIIVNEGLYKFNIQNLPQMDNIDSHSFNGWYYQDENVLNKEINITEDIVITAKWTINKFQVSFTDSLKYIKDFTVKDIPYNTTIENSNFHIGEEYLKYKNINNQEFLEKKYILRGWLNEKNEKITSESKITCNMTLNADWEVITYPDPSIIQITTSLDENGMNWLKRGSSSITISTNVQDANITYSFDDNSYTPYTGPIPITENKNYGNFIYIKAEKEGWVSNKIHIDVHPYRYTVTCDKNEYFFDKETFNPYSNIYFDEKVGYIFKGFEYNGQIISGDITLNGDITIYKVYLKIPRITTSTFSSPIVYLDVNGLSNTLQIQISDFQNINEVQNNALVLTYTDTKTKKVLKEETITDFSSVDKSTSTLTKPIYLDADNKDFIEDDHNIEVSATFCGFKYSSLTSFNVLRRAMFIGQPVLKKTIFPNVFGNKIQFDVTAVNLDKYEKDDLYFEIKNDSSNTTSTFHKNLRYITQEKQTFTVTIDIPQESGSYTLKEYAITSLCVNENKYEQFFGTKHILVYDEPTFHYASNHIVGENYNNLICIRFFGVGFDNIKNIKEVISITCTDATVTPKTTIEFIDNKCMYLYISTPQKRGKYTYNINTGSQTYSFEIEVKAPTTYKDGDYILLDGTVVPFEKMDSFSKSKVKGIIFYNRYNVPLMINVNQQSTTYQWETEKGSYTQVKETSCISSTSPLLHEEFIGDTDGFNNFYFYDENALSSKQMYKILKVINTNSSVEQWYIPTISELVDIYKKIDTINASLKNINKSEINNDVTYWTSSEVFKDEYNIWAAHFSTEKNQFKVLTLPRKESHNILLIDRIE